MNVNDFWKQLHDDRRGLCNRLAAYKVEEWMNDGQEEVARALGCWMDVRIDLGDDYTLMQMAIDCGFVDEFEPSAAGDPIKKQLAGLVLSAGSGKLSSADAFELVASKLAEMMTTDGIDFKGVETGPL